jgi:glycosyltransferase involved in cell wall biosynthesis
MKVLYLLHTSSLYEGSSKSILNTIIEVKKSGIIPLVFLPKGKDQTLCEEFERLGIKYKFIPLKWPTYPPTNSIINKLGYLPKLINLIVKKFISVLIIVYWIKIEGIDIIHTNTGILSEGFWSSKFARVPHVWHLREFQDLDFNLKTLYSLDTLRTRLKRNNNFPISISIEVAGHFNLPNNTVIYNGILSEKLIRFNENKSKYILFVGLINQAKGIKSLIIAFSKFSQLYPEYVLMIAGDTNVESYKWEIHTLIDTYGIQNKINFLGHVADVSSLMFDASLLVVPSKYEGFGRVTVEAIYNGCFVLGRNTGGTKEIISQTGGGLLFSDDEELFYLMLSLFKNGISHYSDMIHQAQQRAQSLYSTEQHSKKIVTLYHRILNMNTFP